MEFALGPYTFMIDGSGTVLRFSPPLVADERTPAIRRMAPRNLSLIFMLSFGTSKMME
jgi:hypothetical protein